MMWSKFKSEFGMRVIDATILLISPLIAIFLRFDGGPVPENYWDALLTGLPVAVIVQMILLQIFRIYRRLWRYAGSGEMIALAGAVVSAGPLLFLLAQVFGIMIPKSLYLLNSLFNLSLMGGARLLLKYRHVRNQLKDAEKSQVLIFGAGNLGVAILKEMQAHPEVAKRVVGFIDDDSNVYGQILYGVPVIGNRQNLRRVVTEKNIQEILIAIPSVDAVLVREIVSICADTGCEVKVIPTLREMMTNTVTMRQKREVTLEDLLGREPIRLDTALMKSCLTGKRILITGAGGSIGSEICRQVAKLSPAKIILLGKGENSIFEIEQELRWNYPGLDFVPVIANITNERRIHQVFAEERPEIIFHAAAHKHVPLMEGQPVEAVSTNIFGTLILAKAAVGIGVERFVMISTDKAVNPSSVMGATKRVAEMIVCNMNGGSKTKFSVVRFGNVLGSRGSVVPLFRKQIAKGGPVTITHPDMTRYFMTIPEASQLVLQAGAMAQGGEVFILDMGQPVKIMDLALSMIELSGYRPHKDIRIEYIGLRPGEKLYEELMSLDEDSMATRHERIFITQMSAKDHLVLEAALQELKNLSQAESIIVVLKHLVPGFQKMRRPDRAVRPMAAGEYH